MRRATTLENRLNEWGKEYGGGRHENTGWQGISPLATIMKFHGRAPQGLNPRRIQVNGPADEVDAAVRKLEREPEGFRLAQILRMEYHYPGKSFEAKAQLLRRVGVTGSRARYDEALAIARDFVAGCLRIQSGEAA